MCLPQCKKITDYKSVSVSLSSMGLGDHDLENLTTEASFEYISPLLSPSEHLKEARKARKERKNGPEREDGGKVEYLQS